MPTLVNSALIAGLGALMIATAGLSVARDVSRYVRAEAARRIEATRRSRHSGACHAAEAIQDRVGNLLSVTVGYVDFLSDNDQLTPEARQHVQRALDSALAATRAVSAFRQSLGCGPSTLRHWQAPSDERGGTPEHFVDDGPWRYDLRTRTIRAEDDKPVALVRRMSDESSEVRAGRLIAEAPRMRETLDTAQRVAATLLAAQPERHGDEAMLRALLERINEVIARVED